MNRRRPIPRAAPAGVVHHQNNRIDISLSHEYLVLYRHGKVLKLISHVSTGGGYLYPCPGGGGTCGPAITPTGNYKTLSFLPGPGLGAARRDVQPDVLHRARLCDLR